MRGEEAFSWPRCRPSGSQPLEDGVVEGDGPLGIRREEIQAFVRVGGRGGRVVSFGGLVFLSQGRG